MGLALSTISDTSPEKHPDARKLHKEIGRFRKSLEEYLKDFGEREFYSSKFYNSVTNALHKEIRNLSELVFTCLEPSSMNPYEQLMKDKNVKKHFSRLDTALNRLMAFTVGRSGPKTQENIWRSLSRVIKVLDSIEHALNIKVDFRKRAPPQIGDTSHKEDSIKGEKREMEKQVKKIFIGHGGSPVWRELKDFLQDRLGLEWVEFNRDPVAGLTAKERLEAMLDEACFAFLIMTAEDEHSDQTKHARENVTHELGLFQGRLGFQKAIILREEGCTEFSNIHGVQDIRFPPGRIMAVSEEVRRVLEREGIMLSKGELERVEASSRKSRTTVIQKIGFDYFPNESPIRKGWVLAEGTLPELTPADYFGGKALAIQQAGRYALDYEVEPAARFGTSVEFVTKLKSGAAIYAHIDVQSKHHSTPERGWIQFQVGTSQPQPLPAGNEWVLYVPPTRFERDWQVFHIDLVDAVNQTFGNEGKSFKHLIGFRLRGNLELACISVFES